MGFKDIKSGTYLAYPVRGAIAQSKKGTDEVDIEFEFETTEKTIEHIWGRFYLSEMTKERTFQTLAICGMNDDKDFDPDAPARRRNQVQIVIEMEEYEEKVSPRVKWVNQLGGKKFSNLAPTEIKATLAKHNFANEIKAAKLKLGLGDSGTLPAGSGEPAPF